MKAVSENWNSKSERMICDEVEEKQMNENDDDSESESESENKNEVEKKKKSDKKIESENMKGENVSKNDKGENSNETCISTHFE